MANCISNYFPARSTTDSSTRCCENAAERIGRSLLWCLCLTTWLIFGTARADAEVRYAEVVRADNGAYVVNANFELALNPRLADAISRGVSLHFSVEFALERPRRLWFDKVIVQRSMKYRLSYHAITRSYRLSIGNLHRNYETLEAALRTMTRVRNWHVADDEQLEAGTSYNARIRLVHDKSMLPRPFQVTTFGSRDWNMGTDWAAWTFLAGAPQ